MDYSDIKSGLSDFVERYDSQTYLGSYRETSRSSLLNDGLSTRANSLWKMAEYVVAKYDYSNAPVESYITGWRQLASNANNQYLLLEEDNKVWGMYDAQGNRLGGEDYILDYFSKMKKRNTQTDTSSEENKIHFAQRVLSDIPIASQFLPYLTALRTKPFMLLAGISGTGKSRIVREMAKACWKEGDEEYGKNHPKNMAKTTLRTSVWCR